MDDQNQNNQPLVQGSVPVDPIVPSVPLDITPQTPPPFPFPTPQTETVQPLMETPVVNELPMPEPKHKSKISPIIGGVVALLLVVGMAGASYYVSNQLSTRQAIAPNAPESEPMAAECSTPLGDWDAGGCSATMCGTTGTRTRTCLSDKCTKPNCVEVSKDYIYDVSCSPPSCPVINDGWGEWTDCTATVCGEYGTKTRTCQVDTCTKPNGSMVNKGGTRTAACGAPGCPGPVNGDWGEWSDCSAPLCETRTRVCDSPEPKNDGAECVRPNGTKTTPGNRKQTAACNAPGCSGPVDDGWDEWGACSATECGKYGTKTRKCLSDECTKPNGNTVHKDGIQTAACAPPGCPGPVNGGWGEWSDECILAPGATCETGGIKTRVCDSPEPKNDGAECVRPNGTKTTPGNRKQTAACKAPGCSEEPGRCDLIKISKKISSADPANGGVDNYEIIPLTPALPMKFMVGDVLRFSLTTNKTDLRGRFRITINGDVASRVWLPGRIVSNDKEFISDDYTVQVAGTYEFKAQVRIPKATPLPVGE